jgi:hypothetical protein
MTIPKVELRCPFCHTVLAPHVTVCHRCRAQKHTRKGMSPQRFRLFVASWLMLAVPFMLAACFVGFAPWGPTGFPPAYALALVGAKPSAEALVRCRVEDVQADGRKSVESSEGACGAAPVAAAAQSKPAADTQPPSLTQRRIATALHTALCLFVGLFTSLGLVPLLRLAFLRKSQPSWVRRATA